jgi:peptidoglycan-associated lipoprotein
LKKSLLALGLGVSIIFVGCTKQPDIEVVEENETEQNQSVVVQPNNTTSDNNVTVINTTPQEQNLSNDNVNVVVETVVDDTTIVTTDEVQNLSALLSKKSIYFDFDKFEIRDDMINSLSEVANILKDNSKTFTIRLEGNCDEWGSDEYNYALGLKRAKAVKNYLSNLGVDVNKLTIISYGESNPVCSLHTKECWQQNRRVNFTILP